MQEKCNVSFLTFTKINRNNPTDCKTEIIYSFELEADFQLSFKIYFLGKL